MFTVSEHALREILFEAARCTLEGVRRRIVEPGGYTPWVVFAVVVLLLVVFQFAR